MSEAGRPADGGETGRRLGAAALLLGASVLLSRVLGYGREAVFAALVGVGPEADAYKAAFQIPDLLNYFLAGGALSIPFVPLYTRYLERGDEAGAERALGAVLGTITVLVTIGTALLFWQAEALVGLYFHDFDPEKQALTVRLTRIVLPGQIFFFAGGILRAGLMARGSFAAHALAPLLYNLAIIAGGLLLEPRLGVEGFSWGCLVGAAIGPFLVPWLDARRQAMPVRFRLAPASPDFRRYALLMAPLCLGATLLTVDEWFDRYFGGRLGDGAIAVLFYARTLMLAPIAAVGQAVATAALPTFSRLFTAGRLEELNRTLQRALEASLALALLAAAGLFVVADPAVKLLYERGAFGPEDTARVAPVLRILCLGVPGWVVLQIAVRAFYAREQMWRPMLIGTAVSLLAIPLYWTLGERHGVGGLAAAGAAAVTVNAVATLVVARALHGGPGLGALAGAGLRVGAVVAVAAALAAQAPGGRPGLAGAVLDGLLRGGVFVALALPGTWLLGGPALRATLGGLRRRRATPAEPAP